MDCYTSCLPDLGFLVEPRFIFGEQRHCLIGDISNDEFVFVGDDWRALEK